MSVNRTHSLSQVEFLTMASNLLYNAFLDSPRTKAKQIYRELVVGQVMPITTVEMKDKSRVQIEVSLDHSEYRGTINFGAFRSSLALLISSLSDSLERELDIKVFSAHHDPKIMIFGVTAMTNNNLEPNIMVLGADMAADRPTVVLNLMFLDARQFEVERTEETA